MQVWESVQERMYAFAVWTIFNVVSIATANLKHVKILRTNTFYTEILLGLFDCKNYCFLIKILLKDISASLSSLSSIPASET